MSNYLFLLLVLACPLMMVWMMRGGHGHGGHAQDHDHAHGPISIDDLRRQRDELDRTISLRESSEEGADDAAVTKA